MTPLILSTPFGIGTVLDLLIHESPNPDLPKLLQVNVRIDDLLFHGRRRRGGVFCVMPGMFGSYSPGEGFDPLPSDGATRAICEWLGENVKGLVLEQIGATTCT